MTWRELAGQAALLLVLVVIMFPGAFFHGDVLIPGDLLFRWEPWKFHAPEDVVIAENGTPLDFITLFNADYYLAQKAMDGGEWPLWNPYEFTGTPLMANFQSAVFYPPRIFHAFLSHESATTLFILLKLWLCGMAAYLCGRGLGLGKAPSQFLSLGWMLCGYNVLWLYWPLPDVSAWTPILFFGAESLLRQSFRRGFFAMTVGGALLLLGGHPESAFGIGLSLGLYFLLRLALDRRWGRPLLRIVGTACAAWAVAILFCSILLFPFLEYLVNCYTFVSRSTGEALQQIVPGSALAAFWVPRFYGAMADGTFWGWDAARPMYSFLDFFRPNSNYVSQLYVGVAPWILGALFIAARGLPRHVRNLQIAMGITAVFSIILATKSPLLGFVHTLPLFSTMWPAYYFGFVPFIILLMGAMGMEHWFSKERSVKSLAWTAPAFALAGVVLVIAYILHRGAISDAGVGRYVAVQVLLFLGVATVSMGLLIVYSLWPKRTLVMSLLVASLAVDLLFMMRGFNHTTDRQHLFVKTDLTDALRQVAPSARVSAMGTQFLPGAAQVYGVEQLWGHESIIPHRIMKYMVTLNPCSWATMEPLCSVSYYLFVSDSVEIMKHDPKFEFIAQLDEIGLFRNRHAYPRAYLVGKLEAVESEEVLFERLCDPAYKPREVALTEAPPSGDLPQSEGDTMGYAHVRERTFNSVTVDAEAAERSVLVLSDAYFPGWKVWVDGVRAELFPVYYAFRGVIVEPGTHVVEYRYEPMSFRLGMAVSVITLLTSLVVAILVLSRRRGRNPVSEPG